MKCLRKGRAALAAALTLGACVFGLQSSPLRAADSWNVTGEEAARFDATVVDILCELTGDCAEDCGGGQRQLGLLTDDGVLILADKNAAPFAGAVDELIPFCKQKVTVDGLFSENRGLRLFAVQFVKPVGEDGKWRRANRFLTNWAVANGVDPESKAKNGWFKKDPRVVAVIEEQGFLGLGPDADRAYLDAQ
ncbi:MAG TPA: hypothetical protein VKN76_05225 [Kiloniellaceae bacterium]|nr:hypothetical protein [Kiloniellaceae bacterium]